MIGLRVLVAPLDWGLGHATRCVPIIQELLKRRYEVCIASSGSALTLLRNEFPELRSFELPSYRASYSKRIPLMASVFLQLPKFLSVIRHEHQSIKNILSQKKIDLLISDNRFGCWVEEIPCVFITHQINIQMPRSLKSIQPIVNYFNHRFIRRFSYCWVPDQSGEFNLTGKLSEAGSISIRHIGLLSRLRKGQAKEKYEVAVILSGPEPQRTIFEKIVIHQLRQSGRKAVVVRGVVEHEISVKHNENIELVNFLPTDQLQGIINCSGLIIARSGYSTVMDLAKLGKKAIFVPTPGQTEQEYLAKRLMDNGVTFYMKQSDFDLSVAVIESKRFKGFSNIEYGNELLIEAINEVVQR